MQMATTALSYLLATLSALFMGAAWCFPLGATSAVAAWLGIGFFWGGLLKAKRPYAAAYLCGVLTNLLGFYWLTGTIAEFGGFALLPTLSIYIAFALFSGMQYLFCTLFYLHLPARLDPLGLRLALAWCAAELLSLRIFPWHVGHTQIGVLPMVQIADVGGSILVSFMVCWMVEVSVRFLFLRERLIHRLWAPLFFMVSLIYGAIAIHSLERAKGVEFETALVQANLSIAEKHDIKYFVQNSARYAALSAEVLKEKRNMLVIWPETVLQEWIAAEVGHVRNDLRLPYFGKGATLLLGSLTHDRERHFYNSAIMILPDGTIPPPYHKRILMPFGEYMPLASWFPWLQSLNPGASHFSSGIQAVVFEAPLSREHNPRVKISPLICYEDVVQDLAREAVRAGAQILVNLTNDAWFGRSAAPFQHHMIAAFRAIENRRYLLRSTNSGFTAVVDPAGRTIASIPIFSEQVLLAKVKAFSRRSLYNRLGNAPWWILSLWCFGAVLIKMARLTHVSR